MWPRFSLPSSQNLKKMKQNFFIDNVYMDTQTAFMANGNINIYPCAWEADKTPVTADGATSFKGRIRVEEDGRTQVTPYNIGSQGPRYIPLFETDHCQVQMTQGGKLIERWTFKPSMTADEILTARTLEGGKVSKYYQSRSTKTVW